MPEKFNPETFEDCFLESARLYNESIKIEDEIEKKKGEEVRLADFEDVYLLQYFDYNKGLYDFFADKLLSVEEKVMYDKVSQEMSSRLFGITAQEYEYWMLGKELSNETLHKIQAWEKANTVRKKVTDAVLKMLRTGEMPRIDGFLDHKLPAGLKKEIIEGIAEERLYLEKIKELDEKI